MNELGRRAVACKHWRWMPGMLAVAHRQPPLEPVIERRGDVNWDEPYPGSLPDLTDPATLGCLLHLVREARPDAYTYPDHGEWVCVHEAGSITWVEHHASTEAEALVAALEAAP